jgi:hypothetical protein
MVKESALAAVPSLLLIVNACILRLLVIPREGGEVTDKKDATTSIDNPNINTTG